MKKERNQGLIYVLIVGIAFITRLDAQEKKLSEAKSASGGEKGLVAYWSFDEGKGELVKDPLNGIIGEVNNAKWVKGIRGNALEFNGEDAYVDCGDDNLLDITEAITIECWIKRTGDGKGWDGIISKGGNNKGYQLFYHKPSQKFYLYLFTDITGYGSLNGEIIPVNEWMHLVAIYDSKEKIAKVFQNGIMTGTKQYEGKISEFSSNFYIGRTTSFFMFNGVIDEVKVYKRVLTENEIQEHYKEMGGKIDTTKQVAPAVVSPPPVPKPAAQAKILLNPSLEENKDNDNIPDGWRPWGGSDKASVSISTEKTCDGKYSIKIEDNDEKGGVGLESNLIEVTPGRTYRATCYAFALSGDIQLYLQFFDSSDKRIGVKIAAVKPEKDWTLLTAEEKAPENTIGCRILFYSHGVNIGTTYYDKAKLEEIGK